MKARDIMTANPCTCHTHDTVQDVARLMRDHDCGSVPVVDEGSGRVVGTITDRDLVVRGLATGQALDTRVGDLMTTDVCCCELEADVSHVERLMSDFQVRRIPVLNTDGRLAGIVSQADLARAAKARRMNEHDIAIVVERISEAETSGAPRLHRGVHTERQVDRDLRE